MHRPCRSAEPPRSHQGAPLQARGPGASRERTDCVVLSKGRMNLHYPQQPPPSSLVQASWLPPRLPPAPGPLCMLFSLLRTLFLLHQQDWPLVLWFLSNVPTGRGPARMSLLSWWRCELQLFTGWLPALSPDTSPQGRMQLFENGAVGPVVPPRAQWGQWLNTQEPSHLYFPPGGGRAHRHPATGLSSAVSQEPPARSPEAGRLLAPDQMTAG